VALGAFTRQATAVALAPGRVPATWAAELEGLRTAGPLLLPAEPAAFHAFVPEECEGARLELPRACSEVADRVGQELLATPSDESTSVLRSAPMLVIAATNPKKEIQDGVA